MPALNSYWIKIHVQAAIWGSSLFALGGIVTIAYLVQDRRRAAQVDRARHAARRRRSWAAPSTWTPTPRTSIARRRRPVGGGRDGSPGGSLVPSAQTLDRLAYRIIALAFPIWTFAVIAGAIWAQEAWGRYWGWDPKETWSFITWVIFAGYLHARATSGLEGPTRGRHRDRRVRLAADHLLRREPVDRGAALYAK